MIQLPRKQIWISLCVGSIPKGFFAFVFIFFNYDKQSGVSLCKSFTYMRIGFQHGNDTFFYIPDRFILERGNEYWITYWKYKDKSFLNLFPCLYLCLESSLNYPSLNPIGLGLPKKEFYFSLIWLKVYGRLIYSKTFEKSLNRSIQMSLLRTNLSLSVS